MLPITVRLSQGSGKLAMWSIALLLGCGFWLVGEIGDAIECPAISGTLGGGCVVTTNFQIS
jgi:hypothetical protein